jgi:tetraacyldisaccharide 4'-kinase
VPLADLADVVWYGESATAKVARAILAPASAAFAAVVSRVNAAYDRDPATPGALPAVSVGNLTVGGTGKTPVSAWFARQLANAGAHPAIVMRGYGEDEIRVHQLLNPDVPVFGHPDRRAGLRRAKLAGADCAILDDAFQHRRVGRVADVVLMSADRWTGEVRLLPSGPYREPLRSLRRATLVVITVKAAPPDRVDALRRAISIETDSTVVTVDLRPASFVQVGSGEESPLTAWRGRRVLAVTGIGDPTAFAGQLEQMGLLPLSMTFADHHQYDASSVRRIVAASDGIDSVVCTLKDAVKLGAMWPSSAKSLWYVSQSVSPRDGIGALEHVVQSVLAARRSGPFSSDLSR